MEIFVYYNDILQTSPQSVHTLTHSLSLSHIHAHMRTHKHTHVCTHTHPLSEFISEFSLGQMEKKRIFDTINLSGVDILF